MSGTVNISRGIWHDIAFKDEPFSEREAFMWIIMEASYKPRQKRVGSITVDLDRGQLVTSVRFMCSAWSWSKSRVDRYLKRLENRDMIGTDIGSGINVITVCKYNDYQNVPKDSGTPKSEKRDSSGTAAGQQRDKPNKGLIPDEIPDVIKRDTNVSPKNGTRLSADWFLSKHLGEWSISEGASHDLVRVEADKFRDYWIGVAGAKGRKVDWDATWRNWIRKAIADNAPRLRAIEGSGQERSQRIIKAAAAGTTKQEWG